MAGSAESTEKTKNKEEDADKFELIDTEGVFSDMYLRDDSIRFRMQEILDSAELKTLKEKARKHGRSIDFLDSVVSENPAPMPFFQRLMRSVRVFRIDPEYSSKGAYLAYLKSVYRFMLVPLEERPGLLYRIFYAESAKAWKPSTEEALDLLEKFFLETKLIKRLSDKDWEKVKNAKDPEVVLNRLLYGIEFKPEFNKLLRSIPWIISHDRYGAPALDLMSWMPPGTEMPQKPIAVDDEFIDELVEGVEKHEAYAKIEIGDKFVDLKDRKQIMDQLKEEERVLVDSYVGVSKIERDFVLHKRLILWRNPGYERWEKESKMGKLKKSRPEPYLVLLQERAQHLEIPFLTADQMPDNVKKRGR